MDHPETDNLLAPAQNPESHPPPARTGLWSRLMSAWNSNPVQMRLALISLLFYMADVITDTMLAKTYYSNGDYHWFGWTLGFVMAPPAVMNILLLVFDIDLLDIKLSLRKWEKCLLNFTCFALPLKYVEIINLIDGGKEVKESLRENLHRWHLFEATFESLPQLCLQLYIIHSTHEQVSVLKVISMVISLLAAVKAVVTYVTYYDRCSTLDGSRPKFVIWLTIWKALDLWLHVIFIAVNAPVYKLGVLLPIGLQWLLMAFCIVIDIHRTGTRYVTEACLHLAICTFSTPFPIGKEDVGTIFRNLALPLKVLSSAVITFCVVGPDYYLREFKFFCISIVLILMGWVVENVLICVSNMWRRVQNWMKACRCNAN